MKVRFDIFFTAFFLLAASCNTTGQRGTGADSLKGKDREIDSLPKNAATSATKDSSLNSKELVFKQWLRDTINNPDFAKTAEDERLNRKKEIIIDRDSLMLTISYQYDLIVDRHGQSKLPEDVRSLISLLKEYDELPKQSFDLTFKMSTDYTPSPADVKYDANDYFEDIQTVISHPKSGDTTVTEYGYIRGRLADKTVTSSRPGSKEKKTEFIWNKRKLIKKEY